MRFEIDTLTERAEPFAHTFATEALMLEEDGARLIAPAEVEGRVSRKGDEVRLRGRIRTTVETLCDRCLKPAVFPVETEFDERYVPAGTEVKTEETELHPDELALSVYDGGTLDADELVREQILLALPTRLLCREECKGLCPGCGADLNNETCGCERNEVDPRWAALAAIKDRES
ncbi:MAG TPA: DUF177 domain-containing protein [Pyrinomonadaceae bacterium]|nr:DUF177 domain-containing protein [Pyrinomonadaceae bacterium]